MNSIRHASERWNPVAFIAIFVITALAGCGQSDWRELTVDDGGFSVLMRAEPHYVRQQLDTPAGKMEAHLYSSDRPDSYFAVGYSDYPLAFFVRSRPEDILAGVRETWLRRINGHIVTSDTAPLGKHPGLQLTARGTVKGQDALLEARLYMVDQRLYQLVAISRIGETPQGIVNRFFNSFRLIEPGRAATIRIETKK